VAIPYHGPQDRATVPSVSEVPRNRLYSVDHFWWRDGLVGLTPRFTRVVRKLVAVHLDDLEEVGVAQCFGTLESDKALLELHSPGRGVIVERNARLVDEPTLILTDPYEAGWLIRVDGEPARSLLDDTEYSASAHGVPEKRLK